MSEKSENSISEDYFIDSGSIKLTESEPLSSNSYIHIDIEPLEEPKMTANARRQRYQQQQSEIEQARQKKQKRKSGSVDSAAAQSQRAQRGAEPALHVIIEHESPYDDYDFEPEVPAPGISEPVQDAIDSDFPGAAAAPYAAGVPDMAQMHPYAPQPWGSQQPGQPIPSAQGMPINQQNPVLQPDQASGHMQSVPNQAVPVQGLQQSQESPFAQPYVQGAYPAAAPVAPVQPYQPFQQMQPMQNAWSTPSAGGLGQVDAAPQGAQQIHAASYPYVSQHQPGADGSAQASGERSASQAQGKDVESVSADGKVIRRPWGSTSSHVASSPVSATPSVEMPFHADASHASHGAVAAPGDMFAFGAWPEQRNPHRGMMSWKKGSSGAAPSSDARELNQAFGAATVPITVQTENVSKSDIPEAYLPPQQIDVQPSAGTASVPAEKQKAAEKPLKINIGTHGKVSTQDHLTISRESIEQLSREQEAKMSTIKTMSSRSSSQRSASAVQSPATKHIPRESKVRSPKRSGSIDAFGAPLLDEAALEESTMFEEPPTSLADGLKAADKSHKKRRKGIVFAVILAILAALAAGVFFLNYTGQINLDSIINGLFSQPGATQQSSNSGTSSASGSSSSARTDRSGTVIYEYTATTSDGVDYKVRDTVTYDSEGNCESTEMDLEFASAGELDSLLSNFERDYGDDYKLVSRNGNKAVITIDISNLKLDREAYEDALRYSVDDLMILKK